MKAMQRDLVLMSELSIDERRDLTELQTCTDVKYLLEQFQVEVVKGVKSIIRMAVIIRQLDEQGVEIDGVDVPKRLLAQLRKVAWGQLLPGILVNLRGDPLLISRSACLPIPDQERVLNDEPMPVYVDGGDHRMVPPSKMTKAEIQQVFAKDHIRDATEQIGELAAMREKAVVKRLSDERASSGVKIDRKRNGIQVGEAFLSATQLALFLAELSK